MHTDDVRPALREDPIKPELSPARLARSVHDLTYCAAKTGPLATTIIFSGLRRREAEPRRRAADDRRPSVEPECDRQPRGSARGHHGCQGRGRSCRSVRTRPARSAPASCAERPVGQLRPLHRI